MVKDLNPGPPNGCLGSIFALGDAIYFEGGAYGIGGGLARSDGTDSGTTMIKVISGSIVSMAYLTALENAAVFFVRDYGDVGYGLWATDGTPDGTRMIKEMQCDPETHHPTKIAVKDAAAYFIADDGTHGYQLWKSDATEAGTTMVTNNFSYDYWRMLGNIDGNIYFRGNQLYRSDGTVEGTAVIQVTVSWPDQIWSQDGITYCGSRELDQYVVFWKLGQVSDNAVEWMDLRDVAQGVVDEASSASRPYTIGNTTYYVGKVSGLWAVNNTFHFVTRPYSAWKTVGDPLELSVECAGGIGTLSYRWYKDGAPIDDATDATFVIESLTEDDGGLYTCRVTDAAKTIYETEPALIEVFAEGELPAAGPASLLVMAAGCAAWAVRRLLRKRQGT